MKFIAEKVWLIPCPWLKHFPTWNIWPALLFNHTCLLPGHSSATLCSHLRTGACSWCPCPCPLSLVLHGHTPPACWVRFRHAPFPPSEESCCRTWASRKPPEPPQSKCLGDENLSMQYRGYLSNNVNLSFWCKYSQWKETSYCYFLTAWHHYFFLLNFTSFLLPCPQDYPVLCT